MEASEPRTGQAGARAYKAFMAEYKRANSAYERASCIAKLAKLLNSYRIYELPLGEFIELVSINVDTLYEHLPVEDKVEIMQLLVKAQGEQSFKVLNQVTALSRV